MIIPRGNVKITPTPIVAGKPTRRMSIVGLVGDVPAARKLLVTATSPGFSGVSTTGDVGVTALAAGRPKLCAVAVAAARKIPASNIAVSYTHLRAHETPEQ